MYHEDQEQHCPKCGAFLLDEPVCSWCDFDKKQLEHPNNWSRVSSQISPNQTKILYRGKEYFLHMPKRIVLGERLSDLDLGIESVFKRNRRMRFEWGRNGDHY